MKETTTENPQLQSKDTETEMLSFRHRAKEKVHKNWKETVAKSKAYQAQGMTQEEAWEALMAEPIEND